MDIISELKIIFTPRPNEGLFEKDLHRTFLKSTRLIVILIITTLLLTIIEDWVTQRALFTTLIWPKLLTIGGILLSEMWLAQTKWGEDHAESIGLIILLFVMAGVVYQVYHTGEIVLLTSMIIFSVVVSAVMISWSVRYHIILVIGSFVAILTAFFSQNNLSFSEVGSETIVVFLFSGVSIILAAHTNQRRYILWQAEKALRESEGRFRQLAEHSKDIIWIWSPDRKIEYISPAYQHFTGTPSEKLYENPLLILDMVHADDREALSESIEGVISGEFREMDLRVQHADGTLYYLDGWGTPVRNRNGDVVRCVGIWHDMTRRVHLTQDLDSYAHAVAHDLKNPIALIYGYADLLDFSSGDKLDSEARDFLDRISNGCTTMTQIIDELLLLASVRKLDDVEITPLDMATIASNSSDRLTLVIDEADATIVFPNEWPVAQGYSAWIEEVWTNYISNAVKYGGSPPQLELGATVESDQMIRFWVHDNGRGLTENEQSQLFREFSRLEPAKASGHGLGLSIVKRIVDKLGGEVGVDSTPGEGSVFWFTLQQNEGQDVLQFDV